MQSDNFYIISDFEVKVTVVSSSMMNPDKTSAEAVTLVLETDPYATVLSMILSFLDTPTVKKASLVSR